MDAPFDFAPLVEPDYDERDALLILSYTYLQFQKNNQAQHLLEVLNALYPNDITVLPLLACSQIRTKQAGAAIKTLNILRSLHWLTPAYYLLYAQASQELRDYPEARQAYQEYCFYKRKQDNTMLSGSALP